MGAWRGWFDSGGGMWVCSSSFVPWPCGPSNCDPHKTSQGLPRIPRKSTISQARARHPHRNDSNQFAAFSFSSGGVCFGVTLAFFSIQVPSHAPPHVSGQCATLHFKVEQTYVQIGQHPMQFIQAPILFGTNLSSSTLST